MIKNLKHSNIVIGNENILEYMDNLLLSNLDFDIKSNPDFLFLDLENFRIDDVRDFEDWIFLRPIKSYIKVCLVKTKQIGHEAQNALLKVLEEPPIGTYIFISLPNLGGIIPTILSRVSVLHNEPEVSVEKETLKFFRSNLKEKFAMIRSLNKKTDKEIIKNLLNNLEKYEVEDLNQKKNILTGKILLSARGSSPKMILEWLSVMM